MAIFPQLNTQGLLMQRPGRRSYAHRTSVERAEWGTQFARSHRAEPLGRWNLVYTLSNAELAILEAFFEARGGKLESFTWLDPNGNLVQYSDDLTQSVWEKFSVTVADAQGDPFGGIRAIKTTSTGSNGMLAASVLPDGGGSGFLVTASVWVRSDTNFGLSLGFIDSGFSVLSNSVIPVAADKWVRLSHTARITTNLPVRILIGGFAGWASGTILHVFGAKAAPLGAAGGYVRSPQNWGYRTKVRFDNDALVVRHLGPNQNQVSIDLVETA